MNVTYDDIKQFDSGYVFWSSAKEVVVEAKNANPVPGKKTFQKLIKKASQPAPKEPGKSPRP